MNSKVANSQWSRASGGEKTIYRDGARAALEAALPILLAAQTTEFGKVTRVEVIENSRRAYTIYSAENVKTALQDEGRTLKVFLNRDRP